MLSTKHSNILFSNELHADLCVINKLRKIMTAILAAFALPCNPT